MSSARPALADPMALLARWVLGAVFVTMGFNKTLHPEQFLMAVEQYHLLSSFWLLNLIGALLPWFEVFCGLLLLAGIAVRGTALAVLAMLIPFTGLVLRRGLALAGAKGLALCAVKFDCGCGNGEVLVCPKLTENTLLILAAVWLVARPLGRWCARFSLFGPSNSSATE